jgi:hypothetical protein
MTSPTARKAQVFAEAFRAEADAIECDPGAVDEGATMLREVAEAVKAIPAWVEDDDIRGWAKVTAERVRACGPSISSAHQGGASPRPTRARRPGKKPVTTRTGQATRPVVTHKRSRDSR